MNPPTSLGGLLGGGGTTTTPATSTTPATTTPNIDLSSIIGADPLSGLSTTAASASGFDPALYEPGGLFSPTPNVAPATPAAQQDPSGQVVDRTGKGDRATTQEDQPTVDRSTKGDLSQVLGAPEAGPTAAPGGDQTGSKGDLTQLASAAGGQQPGAPGGLPQLARQAAQAGQPSPTAAVDQPTATPPQAAGAPPPPDGGAPAGQRQPAAAARAGPASAPQVPGAQPGAPAAAAPTGVPPLLQAILDALGLGGLTRGPQLQQVAGQAYPQRPIAPIAPTSGLGPVGRARARARGQPGQYQQPTQREWERNVGSSGGFGPAPGQTGEVTAPTERQVQQSRLAGTDTPPTAGFSPVLERERSKFRDQLNDPRTRWETLAAISLEMEEDPTAVAESLLNRSDYAKTSIRNMLHSGFYGPINFGKLGGEIRRLQANPERAAKLNAGLETALRGSNLLGGATDQGSARDPNVGHRGGRVVRFNEIYNDWGGGPGGHDGAALWRKQQQQRVRQGQQEAQRGEQFAMDIGRRVPFTGGAEMDVGGGMIRRGAPATEIENITEQRRRRELEQQRTRARLVS